MTKYVIGLAVGVALTLALSAVGVARDKDKAEDEDTLGARKDVLDVLKDVEAGKGDKDLAAKAESIKKKDVELNYLMKVYKTKEKGGIGYGDKPKAESGLEAKIIAMQKDFSKDMLKKEKDDLIKLARVNIAMSEIAKPHFPKAMDGKTKKDWDRWLDEQKAAAKELIEAVKKEDVTGASKAVKEMLNSCTECHAVFRK
jgi:hypothetical protein